MITPFAALPLRALADPRLTRLRLCTLGIIAWHDRRSEPLKKGAGCWASHKTLCHEIGCHYTRLSTAIRDLIAFGYLTSRKNPRKKWHRIYTVIYENSLPIGKLSDETVCLKPKTVCRPNCQTIDGKNKTDPKENLRNRTIDRRDSSKEARSSSDDARLAQLERLLTKGENGQSVSRKEKQDGRDFLNQILNDPHSLERHWQWANRRYENFDIEDDEPVQKTQERR